MYAMAKSSVVFFNLVSLKIYNKIIYKVRKTTLEP
jgi:hypothetical protein